MKDLLQLCGCAIYHSFRSTDFERGFIMAEVMKFDDLKKLGSESAVKAAGKYLQKGKDYKVEDGDIIYFKVKDVVVGILRKAKSLWLNQYYTCSQRLFTYTV
jgi:hypothetical protein